ncbi:excinuclease ABC subunit UvrC [Mycoplasmoides alvi]|uniref:excinuclease ABC subunit UvrC n=1 Tax=Mycoplasmoides alvi TaxID=78580 RepID=UPI00051B6F56|nr:excinuclease ABC subunit UvrC [Mycoplasmoides alvi]
MNKILKNKLKNAPKTYGCYIWKNKLNEVIYVGKAKNIYKRTHQYFLTCKDSKTLKLVNEIFDVNFITVQNENEALILEANLIKKYKPKYNVLLKHNNGYPYFLVTNEKKPRFLYTHEFNPKKGKYYGPFANSDMKAYEIYNLLIKLFPLRKCNSSKNKKCFYYDLNLCMGACVNEDTLEKYELMKKKIDNFFTNGSNEVLNELKIKENLAVERLDFEQAKHYLGLQNAIKLFSNKQLINLNNNKNNADVIGYTSIDNYICIVIFSYVNGKLINKNSTISKFAGDTNDAISSYLFQYYTSNKKPKKIYVSLNLTTSKLLENNLKIIILNPEKGKMKNILDLAIKNAKIELDIKLKSILLKEERTIKANEELGNILKIKNLKSIEIFDNSNIFNVNKVAAMVVYENGEPNKKKYRKYKIKNEKAKSDYECMYEIIYRRYLRLIKEKIKFPELIIVDGGKIQLNAAHKALKELNIINKTNLIGLAKDEKHKTSYIQTINKKIKLDKNSNIYFFLANMQEEVHKFAITYFRKEHQKSITNSILDKITNLGKIRKNKLLTHFGTISKISNATIEELSQFVPKKVAISIKEKLKKENY